MDHQDKQGLLDLQEKTEELESTDSQGQQEKEGPKETTVVTARMVIQA